MQGTTPGHRSEHERARTLRRPVTQAAVSARRAFDARQCKLRCRVVEASMGGRRRLVGGPSRRTGGVFLTRTRRVFRTRQRAARVAVSHVAAAGWVLAGEL